MRLLLRLAIVLGAIVIFSGGFMAPARAQEFDTLFQKAEQLAKEGQTDFKKRQDALQEYGRIVGEYQSKNAEAAAEALYRGGLYAYQQYGTTPEEQRQGQDMALHWWKQLFRDYPNSKAAQALKEKGLFEALQNDIDRRNSSDWKYKVIHALVVLTGNNPSYSYGLALILLAVLVKLLLLPLTKKQYAAMREMQRMQPLIKELQKKYKGQELSQKQMELFKEHGVNPFASCLPTLLQLPFLILVFTAIQVYEIAFSRGAFLWIGSPLSDNHWKFLGHNLIARNLAEPDVLLLTLYTVTNYVTMKMTPATDPQQQQMQNTMAIVTSVMFFAMFLTYGWSSAFVLYWFALNLLSIWQQYEYIYKPHKLRQQNGDVAAPPAISEPQGNGRTPAKAEGKPIGSTPPPARVRPRRKKR